MLLRSGGSAGRGERREGKTSVLLKGSAGRGLSYVQAMRWDKSLVNGLTASASDRTISLKPALVLHPPFTCPSIIIHLSSTCPSHTIDALHIIYKVFFLKKWFWAPPLFPVIVSFHFWSPFSPGFWQSVVPGCYTPVLLVSTTVCLQRELMAYSPRLVPFSSFRSGFLHTRGKDYHEKTVIYPVMDRGDSHANASFFTGQLRLPSGFITKKQCIDPHWSQSSTRSTP